MRLVLAGPFYVLASLLRVMAIACCPLCVLIVPVVLVLVFSLCSSGVEYVATIILGADPEDYFDDKSFDARSLSIRERLSIWRRIVQLSLVVIRFVDSQFPES